MKAKIKARWWNADFQKKFGEFGSVHDFPNDTETFLKGIIPFGRFEVQMYDGLMELEFHNDYD
jgi:hypothetical protein